MGRRALPLQVVLDQDPPDRLFVERELKEIPEEAGAPVGPVTLGLDSLCLHGRAPPPVVAVRPIHQANRPRLGELDEVPPQHPAAHLQFLGGPTPHEPASEHLLNLFSPACVRSSCPWGLLLSPPFSYHRPATAERWDNTGVSSLDIVWSYGGCFTRREGGANLPADYLARDGQPIRA